MPSSITISEIESIEAHASSLMEVARKMRAKIEKKVSRRGGGLTESQKAMLDASREKVLNRRAHKKSQLR